MDELNDFFDFSKEFERIQIEPGFITGNLQALCVENQPTKSTSREYGGTEYTERLILEEQRKLEHFCATPNAVSKYDSLSNDEDVAINDDIAQPVRLDNEYYARVKLGENQNTGLPIYQAKKAIMTAINGNPVVVLEGSTGCGKTTQVPQYIIDDACKRQKYCNIAITQPRRIAAITLSKRVSKERDWLPNSICSYQIAQDKTVSKDTRILYCTTGVLLQILVHDKCLDSFTHIILDEVHERDQDMDFLLILVRRFLIENSPNVKIILMSATIDSSEFSNYFTIRKKPAPIIRVGAQRNFDVLEYYTNDLACINAHEICVKRLNPTISEELYNATVRLIYMLESIEQQEQLDYLENIASILIFLPGIYEINKLNEHLKTYVAVPKKKKYKSQLKFYPVRLHSIISPEEQRLAFKAAPAGCRKIILATNIAESSITVPDVKYVIDFCLTKLMVNDSHTNFSTLQICWASHANCRQRAGRAGRVMNGRVYRMVPKRFYDSLAEFCTPEMLRCPLERVVLKAKFIGMGPPADIIGLAMTPPDKMDICNAILKLKEVGALYTTVNGVLSGEDGDLSLWGRVMDSMPLDVRLTRLILIGHAFGCLEDAIIIAACLSVGPLFLPTERVSRLHRYDVFIQKLFWADGSGSDVLVLWRAYKTYKSLCQHNNLGDTAWNWAKRFHLNVLALHEVDNLVNEINKRFRVLMNLKMDECKPTTIYTEYEHSFILKIIIAGAFYPNYFLRNKSKAVEQQRYMFQKLAGRDPKNTVYFNHYTPRVMGELYSRNIKKIFAEMRIPEENIDVTFERESEKIYVTFKNEDDNIDHYQNIKISGSINSNIIKAVRLRTDCIRHNINIMSVHDAQLYVKKHKLGTIVDGIWHPETMLLPHCKTSECLPSLRTKQIRGYISHIVNCSKFYFQPQSEISALKNIKRLLNGPDEVLCNRFESAFDVKKNMVLAALRRYYKRAVVLEIIHNAYKDAMFKVLFIDYGNIAILELKDLRFISNESLKRTPPHLFECRLAHVQPSPIRSKNMQWNDAANKILHKIALAGSLELEIYSLYASIANVVIHLNDDNDNGTLNDYLVTLKYARNVDENYMSKSDHILRMSKQIKKQADSSKEENDDDDDEEYCHEAYIKKIGMFHDYDMNPPPKCYCNMNVELRGPASPLEVGIYSTMRNSYSSKIDRESINAVSLDYDPQDMHDNLIVGSSESLNKGVLLAKATTLMPNLHGLAAMIIMIFAPRVQLKMNTERTKYISLLAGLGYDEKTKEPLYEEHDILLNLDVELKEEDVMQINKIRYLIDGNCLTYSKKPNSTIFNQETIVGLFKLEIIRLLSKKRKFIEPYININDFNWESDDGDDEFETINFFGSRALFPMIEIPTLNVEKPEKLLELNKHCKKLYELYYQKHCLLCNETFESLSDLRIHLFGRLHRDRESQIGFKSLDL